MRRMSGPARFATDWQVWTLVTRRRLRLRMVLMQDRNQCCDDERVWVWGLPLAAMTMAQVLERVEDLIAAREPQFFVTANLNYAMLTEADPELRRVNERAAFVLADGMPLVWASRFGDRSVPERVAGADLVVKLCERAASHGYRIFLLGGPPGIAEQAANELQRRFPSLTVA